MSTLASLVKDRREELGLSQRAVGIDHALLSRIESGKVQDPSLDTVRKLANGLGLAVEDLATGKVTGSRTLALGEITPDPHNPRVIHDTAEDRAFVESIRELGLVQALTVRRYQYPDSGNWTWMVIDGHRRYAALVHIHGAQSTTPVPVVVRDLKSEADKLLMQLVANVQRSDMHPWDLAKAIGDLVQEGIATKTIADTLHKGRRWVQEMASVAQHLTEDARADLIAGTISISQAGALASEHDPKLQRRLLARTKRENLGEDDIRRARHSEREVTKARTTTEDEKPRDTPLEEFIAKTPPAAAPTPKDDDDLDLMDDAQIEANQPHNHGKPFRWKGAHGFVNLQIVRFHEGSEKGQYTGRYGQDGECCWRRGGASSWSWSADIANINTRKQHLRTYDTPWNALRAAIEWGLRWLLSPLPPPADRQAIEGYIAWAGKQLVKAGASAELAATIEDKLLGELDAKMPLTKADVSRLPRWAKPLEFSHFVILEEGKATLLKGWRAMAGLMFDMYHVEEPDILRSLLDRTEWDSDPAGAPFSFSQIVIRITHKKAR